MTNAFSDFADAVSKKTDSKNTKPKTYYNQVAVLGGGEDARLLAAICLAEGADVTLFSAYGSELLSMRGSSGITLRGSGPIGTYQIDQNNAPSIITTGQLDTCIESAEVIFLSGPVHKQRTYAMVLADHLKDGQVLVLAPGRSLGALETAWFLRIGGCTADVTIVESQGLPYWISANGSVLNLAPVGKVAASTLPSNRTDVLEGLKRFLPNLESCHSVLESGFSDGSALVEFPALLMSGPALGNGAIKVPMGGKRLPEHDNFASLIGQEQRNITDQLANERRTVAKCFGIRNLPDTDVWIAAQSGTIKGHEQRPIPEHAEATRLLRDGVIGSLVPLLSAADLAGTCVPITQAMIRLAEGVLGADVAAAGRRLDTIGITSKDIDTARQVMDAIATGNR